MPPKGTPAKTLKVLFIGNSYTYCNDLPKLFESISNMGSDRARVDIKMLAASDATLEYHWLSGHALSVLQAEPWDYVVLQEQSRLGELRIQGVDVVNSPALFHIFVRLFDQAIQHSGAKTVLMLTWAHHDRPADQVLLNQAYYSIAEELNASVIPVGPVWEKVNHRFQEELTLYSPDGGHPSPMGSLVAASVFYAFFFNEELDADYRAIKDLPFQLKEENTNTSKAVSFNDYGARFDEVLTVAQSLMKDTHTLSLDGLLHTSVPYAEPPILPPGKPFTLSVLQGRWTGPLTFYKDPAELTINIQQEKGDWHADICLALSNGSTVSSRWPLTYMQPASADNDMLFIVLEATHDYYTAVYTGNALIGIVRGDHGIAPEANRYGSWTLTKVQ